MIRKSDVSFQRNLLHLFNKIYDEGIFPDAWRTSIVIPFLKPKKDSTDPNSYRPVSLTSCICKLLEKMVNHWLNWYLERSGCITEEQSGFRRNRSTTDQLTQLSNDIHKATSAKEHTVVVFFDINKAYDTVWRYGILKTLHEVGLKGKLPRFIEAFLKETYCRKSCKSTI